jgi:hypothetical protein
VPGAAAVADTLVCWQEDAFAARLYALCCKAARDNPQSSVVLPDEYGDRAMECLLTVFARPGVQNGPGTLFDNADLQSIADREDFQDLRRKFFANRDARRTAQPKK